MIVAVVVAVVAVVVAVVVVAVERYCFLINIIVEPPQPVPPHFYFAKVMFFTFSSVSPRRKHDGSG